MFNNKNQLHCSTANPGTAGKNGRPGQASAFRKRKTNPDRTFIHVYTYSIAHQNLGGGDGDESGNEMGKMIKYNNFIFAIIDNEVEQYSDALLETNFNMYRSRQN